VNPRTISVLYIEKTKTMVQTSNFPGGIVYDLKDRRGYSYLKEEALDLSSDRLLNE